jgi:hypothetical protein
MMDSVSTNNIPVRCTTRTLQIKKKNYPLNPLASNWALGSASPLLGGLVNQFPTFNPKTKQQIHPLTHFATLFSINKRKKKTTLS